MGWKDAPVVTGGSGGGAAWQQAPVVGQAAPEPSTVDVALNAIPKGIANLINAPAAIANLAVKGLSALPFAGHFPGLQQAASDASTELGQNFPMQAAEKLGAVDPAKNPQTGVQRVIDTGIQAAVGAAAGPGSILRNAAVGATSGTVAQTTKELTGSDLLGLIAGMATPLAISKAMQPRVTSSGNAVRDQTLQEALDAGYVVQPSTVKPSLKNNKLESIAGKAAVAQDAAVRNQEVTNRLAAKAIGLPEDTPLTMGTIEKVREQAAGPYREIAGISPRAKSALEQLQQTRFDAREQWNYYNRSGNPEAGKLARNLDARANMYEQVIEKEAKKIIEVFGVASKPSGPTLPPSRQIGTTALVPGGAVDAPSMLNMEKIGERTAGAPDILQRFRAARQLLARTHDVEKALNLGDGNVSAAILGRLYDQGRPLTGELRTIGKFAQAFPRVARDAASVPPAGVSGTDAASAAFLGTGGFAAAGPIGIAAAGLPLLRGPARNLVLSQRFQSGLLPAPAQPLPLGPLGRATGAVIDSVMRHAPFGQEP